MKRQCTMCHKTKDLDEFEVDKKCLRDRRSTCRLCREIQRLNLQGRHLFYNLPMEEYGKDE